MCGIAGAVATITREGLVRAVEKMTAAMVHRGPDDGGVSSFESGVSSSPIETQRRQCSVVLGARRLAILDLSTAGHQPMQAEEAGLTITYNGETYNFRELRDEIGDEFGSWKSNTDTEVVLRAYRKWGVKAFAKFRGMFAIAVWDAVKQELILARDPFGIKPLYYSISKFEILFASEIRALLASDLVSRNLSIDGVTSYLQNGSVAAPLTIVNAVRSLMPGHYLRVRASDDALKIQDYQYVDVANFREGNGVTTSRQDTLTRVRQTLEESVRAHLVSDVPLGVFLSGGMDSSALVGLLSHVATEKPKTFSVVFDEKRFNEAPHSRLVAKTFDTDHREIHLNENQLLDLLPAALGAMDQPTMDAVNTFIVSKAVKEAGVTVALSGLGGDELFAGYPSFRRAQRLHNMPGLARSVLRSAAVAGKATLSGTVQRNKLWELAQGDGSAADVYRVTRQLFSANQINALLAYPPAIAGGTDNVTSIVHRGATASGNDVINTVSQLELTGYMANTLLRDTDAMSMAHSLEVRVPFVDVEVARLVLSLPGHWKLNGGRTKPLLADALADVLPAEVLQRSKMGFTLPFEKWMQSRLRGEMSSVLQDDAPAKPGALNPGAVSEVWHGFLRSPRSVGWSRPWALYVLNRWCEINGVIN